LADVAGEEVGNVRSFYRSDPGLAASACRGRARSDVPCAGDVPGCRERRRSL